METDKKLSLFVSRDWKLTIRLFADDLNTCKTWLGKRRERCRSNPVRSEECTFGLSINDVTQFWTFFDQPPFHRNAFYHWGLCTVVTKSVTPSPKTVTSFMDDPFSRWILLWFVHKWRHCLCGEESSIFAVSNPS